MVGQAELSSGERTAESLVPAIGGLLDQTGWQPHSVQLVCVVTGPGSFTGLRMGITTAKTFAYAAGANLVGIHTLAALAYPVSSSCSPCGGSKQFGRAGRLWTIFNAQRQELFVACFEQASTNQQVPTTHVVGIPAWLAQLQPGDTIVGPPLEKLASRLPKGVKIVEKRCWQPDAVAVGQLGVALALQSKQVHPMQLVPQYYRKSAAEEKKEERGMRSEE
jgi:tRNA threonylcarbamoyladenosine biosynthesis protein TsaB